MNAATTYVLFFHQLTFGTLKLILGVCTLISAIDANLFQVLLIKSELQDLHYNRKRKFFFPNIIAFNEISHYPMNRAITFTGKEFE